MKGRERTRLFMVMVLIAIMGSMATIGGYYLFVLIQVKTIPMDVTIADKVGFNAGTDALHFGTVYAGGESYRSVFVMNNNSFPVTVMVINSGSLSHFVDVDSDRFALAPYTNASIGYTCALPADAKQGLYNGTSKIIVRRVLLR
jgi:hypothetical protein